MAEHPFQPLKPAVLPESEHAMEEFAEFLRQEAINPPKVNELFKIPEGLSLAWQGVFDGVAGYYERQSTNNRLNLISLEKRSWIMEDENLSEFEMLSTATRMKEKGNEEFRKGNLVQAQVLYVSAVATFPTPDVMNNLAACCLRLNQYDKAEKFATEALDMHLFTNSLSAAKAYFRRSTARLHLADFSGALEDVKAAQELNPGEQSIKDLLQNAMSLNEAVKTPTDVADYLRKHLNDTTYTMTFAEGLSHIAKSGMGYIRLPLAVQEDMKNTVGAISF
ncbi:hypothetical protein HYPSUDRAFT_148111 [Hypholoma sublateritium FD-334 SS-4]|uniref:Uncharacterized protein n=1 Tax=Hypholoma sublateritium (strain FD-334 SS-4) TaxID=945553 RepID=A0A0D2P741_HYPSF|nr:hypothetical protein HYPSUDRAFT_148111 [Hypholoma sublateritium FD-334 SS-4]